MSSERQTEANRLNAQKSTGPSTPEGRAAVRLNGLKYGLYAQTLILPGEDPAEFDALLGCLDAEHQPATPTEEAFVSQIAMAIWRRARIQRMEVAFFQNQHKEFIRHDVWYRDLDDTARLALVAQRDANARRLLDSLSRQEARLDRAIKSAVHELRLCRAGRRAPANQASANQASANQASANQASANQASDNQAPDNPDNKETSERPKAPSTPNIGFGFQMDTARSDSPPNPAPQPPPPTAR